MPICWRSSRARNGFQHASNGGGIAPVAISHPFTALNVFAPATDGIAILPSEGSNAGHAIGGTFKPRETIMARIHHRTIRVGAVDIFYRETQPRNQMPGTPPILLLHGFPSSSHQYRSLMQALGDDCWFPRGTEPVFPPRSEPPLSMVF
jgi:hypothetical protein